MAANRERGEVALEVSGRTYVMALTVDAMCALEAMFSTPAKFMTFQEITDLAERGSMTHIRGVVWAVMLEHQPEFKLSDVSKLVRSAGGLTPLTVKLAELVAAAQPDQRDLDALGVKQPNANPPQAQAARRGTGAGSTSKPAAQT